MAKRAVYQIAEFKAAGDASGEFKALVSVFNNVDLVGDRVMPGAFKSTLARWKASGDPIPVIWSHDWQDPYAHIGTVTAAEETDAGLQVTGKLDLDKPFAKQVHDLLMARRVTGMSFAYDVIGEKTAKDGANDLTELDLIEVGPTLKGANQDAHLIGAKALLDAAAAEAKGIEHDETIEADGMKAGRRLSQSTVAEMQKIHDGMSVLQEQMKALMGSGTEDAPKSVTEPAEQLPDSGERTGTDVENSTEDDREPEAKSIDSGVLAFKTRIESLRA